MLRSISIILVSLSAIFIFPSNLIAATSLGVHVLSADETELSFHIAFDSAAANLAKPEAGEGFYSPPPITLPLDEKSSLAVQIVCFLAPSRARVELASSNLILGAKTEPVSTSLSVDEELFEVRLVEPILVRGMRLGKVVIPLQTRRGNDWYQVSGVDIRLRFDGEDGGETRFGGGRLDSIVAALAINSEQILSREAKRGVPEQDNVYNPYAQSSNWIRIAVKGRGVYKISRVDLSTAGVDVASIDPRSFRLFHGGGKPLPTRNSMERDSLAEVAIAVFGEEDAVFGGDDFIMFYANSPDFWDWRETLTYRRNPYGDRNVFYLTYGGSFTEPPKRMAVVDGSPQDGLDTLTNFIDPLHFEGDSTLSSVGGDIEDYFHWYWSADREVTILVNLPTPIDAAGNSFRVRAEAAAVSVELNGSSVASDSIRPPFFYFTSDDFHSGMNQLNLQVIPLSGGGYTDFVEVFCRRPDTLTASGELFFFGAGDGMAHNYSVTGVSGTSYLIDISDLANQRLVSPQVDAGRLLFASQGAGGGKAFALVTAGALWKPFSIVKTQIDDIRSPANRADLIIITHDNFYNQALDFAGYRQNRDGIAVRVVRISDVYAQFSGGLVDPVAIRDFLAFACRNWSDPKPSFCLLAGDGVYDFRNYTRSGAVNYIPPYIVEDDSTISDENYVHFGEPRDLDPDDSYPTDRGVDMVIARWPVKSASEFRLVADKMKRYEDAGNSGSWRNLITLIADDQNHPESGPETQHTYDSERLANETIPTGFDLNKIYGIDYPFVGNEKPEAREAIIRAINNGALVVNYIGHGNPNLWADERMFRRVTDIPRLKNRDRLPLIFNASCSIGFFDDPLYEGMAEDLLRYDGGAIGTVSATRLVYSRPNFEFNQAAFAQLFAGKDYTIAEAVYVAKLLRQGSGATRENDRKYIYIGDPLTRLGSAPNAIRFARFEPDSLVALAVTELSGVVEDESGAPQDDFNGSATVAVFDNERVKSFQFSPYASVSYKQYGPELYRGRVDVVNGRFDLRFVVPKDISYGGTKARISCYATSATSGAAGAIFPIPVGSINKNVNDSTGPEVIAYFADDPDKAEGAEIAQNARLTVDLFDSLGINLSGDIGHGIEAVIDGDHNLTYALTDSFTYLPGSYQRGAASMTLPGLPPAEHRLSVKAWDSANNSSQKELAFRVTAESGLAISQLLCYPNPVRDQCQFSYILSEDAENVTLKIFTVSGLQIYAVDNLPGSSGYHGEIMWNLRDGDGDIIANGVYIFQLSALPALSGAGKKDDNKAVATSKLVVMK